MANETFRFIDPDEPEAIETTDLNETEEKTIGLEEENRPVFSGEGGLYVVIGGGGSGKSKFLTENCRTIIYAGEPDHRAISLDRGLEVLHELSWASRHDSFDPSENVVGFDSLKDLTYNSGGAALSDGINSGMFVALSDLAACLMMSRVRIVASLNPTQDKLVDPMYQLLLSNVTGVAELRGGEIVRSHERIWNTAGYYDRVDGSSFSFLSPIGRRAVAASGTTATSVSTGSHGLNTGGTVARHILQRVSAEAEFINFNHNEV